MHGNLLLETSKTKLGTFKMA